MFLQFFQSNWSEVPTKMAESPKLYLQKISHKIPYFPYICHTSDARISVPRLSTRHLAVGWSCWMHRSHQLHALHLRFAALGLGLRWVKVWDFFLMISFLAPYVIRLVCATVWKTCHFAWYLLHFGVFTFHSAWYLLFFGTSTSHLASYLLHVGSSNVHVGFFRDL